jgi:DNA replication protein DnaC
MSKKIDSTEQTPIKKLRQMGLRVSEDAVLTLAQQAQDMPLSFLPALGKLMDLELDERECRNLDTRLRVSKLRSVAPIDKYDWAHPQKIIRALYEHLCECSFIGQHQNVLFRGPCGVGKTTLAKYLGMQALKRGYSVRFDTLAAMLSDLLRQESLPALKRRLNIYSKPALLIIDELGYLPADKNAADMLFNVLSLRHENVATIITTNLSFKQWGILFDGAGCMHALVDRFAEHCHVFNIEGESWRHTHALSKG